MVLLKVEGKLENKKKLKRKYYQNILFIRFVVVFLFINLGIMIYMMFLFLPLNYETKINYIGLNESEINYIKEVLSEVKPFYLERTRSIIFYNESIIFDEDESIIGYNLNREIKLKYTNNFKEHLCHEFLHNWIRFEEEPVYDIAKYGVCYKEKQQFIIYKDEKEIEDCEFIRFNRDDDGKNHKNCGYNNKEYICMISKKDLTKEFLDENCRCVAGLNARFCSYINGTYCGYNGICTEYWCSENFTVEVIIH